MRIIYNTYLLISRDSKRRHFYLNLKDQAVLGHRYNRGSLLDLLPLAYSSRCLQLTAAENIVLGAEEHVLRNFFSDLLYEQKESTSARATKVHTLHILN